MKEEVVGRKPTKAEYKEGRDNGLAALLARLNRDGVRFTARIEEVYVHA